MSCTFSIEVLRNFLESNTFGMHSLCHLLLGISVLKCYTWWSFDLIQLYNFVNNYILPSILTSRTGKEMDIYIYMVYVNEPHNILAQIAIASIYPFPCLKQDSFPVNICSRLIHTINASWCLLKILDSMWLPFQSQ